MALNAIFQMTNALRRRLFVAEIGFVDPLRLWEGQSLVMTMTTRCDYVAEPTKLSMV